MSDVICAMEQAELKSQKEEKDRKKFEYMNREDWEKAIDLWIFSERDREILKRRLLDGICFEPLAEESKLSTRQTKTIVKKCMAKLNKVL